MIRSDLWLVLGINVALVAACATVAYALLTTGGIGYE